MPRPFALLFGPSLIAIAVCGMSATRAEDPMPVSNAPATSAEAEVEAETDAANPAEPEATAEAEKYRLRYAFANDDLLRFNVLHSSHVQARKGDIRETTETVSRIRKHLRVVTVRKNGNAILESVVEHARMGVRFDGADPVVFDSDRDKEPPKQFRGVRKRIGRPLARMEVDPLGKLVKLTPLVDDTAEQRREVDSTTDNVLVEFPEEPVAVGDSWSQTFEIDVNVGRNVKRQAKMLRRFELESVEDGIAVVAYRINVLTPVTDPAIQVQLIQRTPTGRIRFDLERGRLMSRTQSLDEEVFGPFGPGSSMHAVVRRKETLDEADPAVKTAAAKRP